MNIKQRLIKIESRAAIAKRPERYKMTDEERVIFRAVCYAITEGKPISQELSDQGDALLSKMAGGEVEPGLFVSIMEQLDDEC